MSAIGIQSPLGINVLSALLSSTGLTINPIVTGYIGASKTNSDYSFGKIVSDSVLRTLTWAINDGYNRGPGDSNATLTNDTYDNLISIGNGSIPALGNSKPSTFTDDHLDTLWTQNGSPATTGYSISGNTGQGQAASWLPYNSTNPNVSVTQWGYIRLHALQAWNEFNWNGTPSSPGPTYSNFTGSFMTAMSSMRQINSAIMAAHNANAFLDGTYSNMNDLITSDIAGVNLAFSAFGKDLVNLGFTIDLARIDAFGLPSVLLANLYRRGGIVKDLLLLLLAQDIQPDVINSTLTNITTRPAMVIEQKIYEAFKLIIGQNLEMCLAALNCKTSGIETLADLLDIKKIFPQSYNSLTVPMYNDQYGLATNSKTYYLIYSEGGINSALTTPSMNAYVGEQLPTAIPTAISNSQLPENYVTLRQGFGSYLRGILPADQAIAAGAFQFSMRQISKIQSLEFTSFAKIVSSMETTTDLPLVAGTSKPTSQVAIDQCKNIMALGSGPHGTYTVSDFFGNMSGLPYAWKLISQRISQIQTQKLANIYQQLFLATTWEQATATVDYTEEVIMGVPYYTPTGITITSPGGGYGRGTAPAPTATLSNGGTVSITIGTDDSDIGSVGQGEFGRVTNIALLTTGSATTSIPTIAIQAPPTAALPVGVDGNVSVSGSNTANGTTGWQSPMNSVVQSYIDQANTEIESIASTNQVFTQYLNAYWAILGSQLIVEQQSRYIGIAPVSLLEMDPFLAPSPSTEINFVNDLSQLAKNTFPHMSAQTIESIVDWNSLGGQSIIALCRLARNQARLNHVGLDVMDSLSTGLSPVNKKTVLTNGVLARAGVNSAINSTTNPAWQNVEISGEIVSPAPSAIYLPSTTELIGKVQLTSQVADGDLTSILENQEVQTAGTLLAVGPSPVVTQEPQIVTVSIPDQLDPASLPPELNSEYTNSTLVSSSPSPLVATEITVTHNCDCWLK